MDKSSLPPLLPDGRSRRPSASWPMRKLRAMIEPFKPLRGGPLLDDCTQQRVDCGSVDIVFFLPRAYFGTGRRPSTIDLDDDRLFNDRATDERAGHSYAKIGGSNWSYYSPIWDINRFLPIPHEPYAIITATWQIERVKRGVLLEVGDMIGLERYLREDYELFLESEGGINWNIRRDVMEEFGIRDDLEPDEAQAFLESQTKIVLRSPPGTYEKFIFNGQSWLRYLWDEWPGRLDPTAINYSRTLSSRTILTVYFGITHLGGGSGARAYARWWKTLFRDSEVLMNGVTITEKCLPAPPP